MNLGPSDYDSAALTTELIRQIIIVLRAERLLMRLLTVKQIHVWKHVFQSHYVHNL